MASPQPDATATATAAATPAQRCPNCGEDFGLWQAQRPLRFCPACGQETRVRAPRMGEFLQQFGGAYLATEGALWRTLRLLLCKPGELTARYLAGQRKHFVLPLRLYLTISVVMLLALRMLSGSEVKLNDEDADKVARSKPNLSVLTRSDGSGLGLRDGVFYCDKLPAWVCKRAQRRIDIDPKAVAGAVEQFRDRFVGNLGGAMFLLLPSFALWLKLVYLNRRMHYTEHLVFALHVHAFWFLALGLAFTDTWWLVAPGLVAVPIYTLMAMRRVYGGRRWVRVLRAGMVSLLYGIVLAVTMAVVAIWSLLF